MNERTDNEDRGMRDERAMTRLLRLAGPRAPIPQAVEARVYNRVLGAWQDASASPRTDRVYSEVRREWAKNGRRDAIRRWAIPVAMAAMVVLVVATMFRQAPPEIPETPAGSVARVVGDGGPGGLPAVGTIFHAGDRIQTGRRQGVSLRLANAESLRLDENTVVEVGGQDRFRLVRGRLYADSGDLVYRAQQLVIDTAFGTVTDVGTQFIVASGDESLEVAVREGRVQVALDSAPDATVHTAVAGEIMRVSGQGRSDYDRIAANDDYWQWATSLAPEFDIENKSLLDFLRWAARETGRELVFADPELRMAAMRTDLHGSVAGFEPLEALASVLATTAYRYHVENDRIVIER